MTRAPMPDPSARSPLGIRPPDAEITRSVGRLIAAMPSVHVDGVRVQVLRGVVTVGGGIPWSFERDTLLNLIAAVPGVSQVVDAVIVRRTDRDPQTDV